VIGQFVHPDVKRKLFVSAPIIALLSILLAVPGCRDNNHWKQEGDALVLRSQSLDDQMLSLNTQIDSLWDTISVQLANALPPDFPSIDRDIFINARNADHIRMFMSYKLLDSAAQDLVQQAGTHDSILAQQVRDLYLARQDFEREKIQFLGQIEKLDKTTSQEYAEKFRLKENALSQ
jgi:hypothetical protein